MLLNYHHVSRALNFLIKGINKANLQPCDGVDIVKFRDTLDRLNDFHIFHDFKSLSNRPYTIPYIVLTDLTYLLENSINKITGSDTLYLINALTTGKLNSFMVELLLSTILDKSSKIKELYLGLLSEGDLVDLAELDDLNNPYNLNVELIDNYNKPVTLSNGSPMDSTGTIIIHQNTLSSELEEILTSKSYHLQEKDLKDLPEIYSKLEFILQDSFNTYFSKYNFDNQYFDLVRFNNILLKEIHTFNYQIKAKLIRILDK